jgi:hypothetical protein
MQDIIVFDCEFLTAPGAPTRFWCGPHDPDPIVAQIGLVRIGMGNYFPLLAQSRIHVTPQDRHGARVRLDPLFTRLTGITEDVIDAEGVPLQAALDQMRCFAGDAPLWSWGKDEFNLIAISCYVAGIAPPIPVQSFGNACQLLLKAGMPYDDLIQTRSNTLSAYFNLQHPPLRDHDALDDALSVAYVIRHLLQAGKLSPADCLAPGNSVAPQ